MATFYGHNAETVFDRLKHHLVSQDILLPLGFEIHWVRQY